MKVRGGGDFTPAPAGTFAAVCVDIQPRGWEKRNYAGEEKWQETLMVAWQLEERMDNGKPFLASKFYNFSINEKSNLYADLTTWRGEEPPFDPDMDYKPKDILTIIEREYLLKNCLLNIIHRQSKMTGRTYANIKGVLKPTKSAQLITPEDYVRLKDREPKPPDVFDATGEFLPIPSGTADQEEDPNVPF